MAKNLNRQSYQYSHPCRLPQNNGGKSVLIISLTPML